MNSIMDNNSSSLSPRYIFHGSALRALASNGISGLFELVNPCVNFQMHSRTNHPVHPAPRLSPYSEEEIKDAEVLEFIFFIAIIQ